MKALLLRLLFILFLFAGFPASFPDKVYAVENVVIVTTDKSEYGQGETMKITLRNELGEDIFSHAGSQTPVFSIDKIERRSPEGDWDRLFAQCQYPHCIYDIDGPAKTQAGQAVSFEWAPRIYIDGTNKNTPATPGVYRLMIAYQIKRGNSSADWNWLQARSNEFTIK